MKLLGGCCAEQCAGEHHRPERQSGWGEVAAELHPLCVQGPPDHPTLMCADLVRLRLSDLVRLRHGDLVRLRCGDLVRLRCGVQLFCSSPKQRGRSWLVGAVSWCLLFHPSPVSPHFGDLLKSSAGVRR